MLSPADQQLAIDAGRRRYARRRAAGSKHRYNRPQQSMEQDIQQDIDGCGSEIETARFLDVPWVETTEPDPDGDIAPGVQVRHTVYANGCLLLHPTDVDSHAFYLVTGNFPDYQIKGWTIALDGKREEHWKELRPGRPCYAVPQRCLLPARRPSIRLAC